MSRSTFACCRAVDRGEIASRFSESAPVLANIIPAMSTHRLNSGGEPVTRGFYVSVVDDVVLAAVGLGQAV